MTSQSRHLSPFSLLYKGIHKDTFWKESLPNFLYKYVTAIDSDQTSYYIGNSRSENNQRITQGTNTFDQRYDGNHPNNIMIFNTKTQYLVNQQSTQQGTNTNNTNKSILQPNNNTITLAQSQRKTFENPETPKSLNPIDFDIKSGYQPLKLKNVTKQDIKDLGVFILFQQQKFNQKMFQEVSLFDLKINGRWCPICNLPDCMENSYRTLRAFDETMQELQEYVEFGVYDGISSIDSEEEEEEIQKHVLNFYRERVYLRQLWAHKNRLF